MAITPTPAAPRAPRHFLVRCFRALAWLLECGVLVKLHEFLVGPAVRDTQFLK